MKLRPLFHLVQIAVLFFYCQCCYIGLNVSTGQKISGLACGNIKPNITTLTIKEQNSYLHKMEKWS